MNKVFRVVLSSILFLLLYSCSSDKKDRGQEFFDKEGKLQFTIETVADKDTVYIKRHFYEDGTLKKVQYFDRSLTENGTYKFYYSNGLLADSSKLVNGEVHGERYQYTEEGALDIVSSYYHGRIRFACHMDTAGEVQLYKGYDYEEELAYLSKYSFGEIVELDEELIYSLYTEDSVPNLDTFDIQLLVANIPHYEMEFKVARIKDLSEKPDSFYIRSIDSFNSVNYASVQNPISDYYLVNIATLSDSMLNQIASDTLFIKVAKNGLVSYKWGGTSVVK